MAQNPEKDHRDDQKNDMQNGKDLQRLKAAWEHLLKAQTEMSRVFRKSRDVGQISSVDIVTDMNGRKSIQISLIGGGKITDIGDKRALFQKMIPQKSMNTGRIASLLNAVREYGFAAVAMGLSPTMKDALLKACKRCNIPLTVERKPVAKQNRSYPTENTSVLLPSLLSQPSRQTIQAALNEQQVQKPVIVSSSVSSLERALHNQKKANKEYLKQVLDRTEKKTIEKYMNRLRSELIDIEALSAQGKDLTANQKQVLKQAEKLGLTAGDLAENPTEEQMKKRQNLSLKDMPADLQHAANREKERYCAICEAKNKAADVICAHHAHEIEQGHKVSLTDKDLAKEAAAMLPETNKRDIKNLKKSLADIEQDLADVVEKMHERRGKRREKIKVLLSSFMKKNDKTPTEIKKVRKEHSSPITKRTAVQNTPLWRELAASHQKTR